MSHLSREELIDSLDGHLPAHRQQHADTCPRCRHERAALAAIVEDVRGVDVPEPSPLFWDHLSARVRERVMAEPTPVPESTGWGSWGASHRLFALAATLALCTVASWLGWQEMRTMRSPRLGSSPAELSAPAPGNGVEPAIAGSSSSTPRPGTPSSIRPSPGAGLEDDGGGMSVAEGASSSLAPTRSSRERAAQASAGDEDWNLMVGLAEELGWDDEAGSGSSVRPGMADAVVRELSLDERQELARLLHEELARPPSSL